MVVEQVDKAPKRFGSTRPLSGLEQQVHQSIIHIRSTGVGLPKHAADHHWADGIAEQGGAQPALPHHHFQERPQPGHPGGLRGQLFVVHQTLGTVDQHDATTAITQQLRSP